MSRYKYRWTSAFGTSLICHAVVLGAITALMIMFPPAPVQKGPIEVDLVTMSGGGGGGGGSDAKSVEDSLPKIKAAQATPTAPPPVPTEPDPEAENDVHEIADRPDPNASQETNTSTSATGTSDGSADSSGGSGGGTGGGTGTGNGTGTGSGEGSGSGSGSGGGTGSGYGDGMGDGAGSGETMGPQLLSAPSPAYPESARRANISGTTVVGLTISTDGSVSSAWVVSSSGNGELDSAAVNAVYSWQFVPAKQNGTPVVCNSQVPVTFNLRG